MNCIYRRIVPAVLLLGPVLTFTAPVQAQNSVTASARPAISVLDSTKEQDGLVGSVRRVKTETARIDIKDGRPVEGAPQLVEITTYGIRGNRIENTSYPLGGSLVGKEEYKYDKRGNITEMTLRDNRGAILSREAYTYEFDKFGNWTKMLTSLVVFENGALKREPVEVTYRTVTYYFDDNVAKALTEPEKPAPAAEQPAAEQLAAAVPQPSSDEIRVVDTLKVEPAEIKATSSSELAAEPPPLIEKTTKVESAFAARKDKEVESPEPIPAKTEAAPAAKAEPEPDPVTVASDQKRANDFYLTGRGQFDAGDVEGAVDSYLQSIKLEPGSAEVFLNLGHAYLKLKKDREAVKAFKESVKLNPEVAETFYGLGFANFRTRRFHDAADAFKKATALSPKMGKAHYGLALAYQETGYTHGLMAEYRVLEGLDPSLAKKLAATFPQYNFSCRLLLGCP
jgi:tetratricopeptide (TPR) repeat protein